MQLNKIHSVKTIDRVAAELGETVNRLFELAIDMEPEDGVIWVYGPNDNEVMAFSPLGIENLREIIDASRKVRTDASVVPTEWLPSIHTCSLRIDSASILN